MERYGDMERFMKARRRWLCEEMKNILMMENILMEGLARDCIVEGQGSKTEIVVIK